jgi:nicotinamide-nucleotide amidase
MKEDRRPEEKMGSLLRRKKATLSVAESCTGGLIAHRITNVSGSSDYFQMGIVSYTNRSKVELLSVPERDIDRYGAVSSQVAGIAGPLGGSRATPVGTVFIALDHEWGTEVRAFHFEGNRKEIKEKASQKGLEILMDHLLEMGNKASKKTR